jgi:hypothetical protein
MTGNSKSWLSDCDYVSWLQPMHTHLIHASQHHCHVTKMIQNVQVVTSTDIGIHPSTSGMIKTYEKHQTHWENLYIPYLAQSGTDRSGWHWWQEIESHSKVIITSQWLPMNIWLQLTVTTWRHTLTSDKNKKSWMWYSQYLIEPLTIHLQQVDNNKRCTLLSSTILTDFVIHSTSFEPLTMHILRPIMSDYLSQWQNNVTFQQHHTIMSHKHHITTSYDKHYNNMTQQHDITSLTPHTHTQSHYNKYNATQYRHKHYLQQHMTTSVTTPYSNTTLQHCAHYNNITLQHHTTTSQTLHCNNT